MFNRRLKVFLVSVLVVGVVFTLRLVQLQIVQASDHIGRAEQSLRQPESYIPAVRGRIFDCYGELLASDEPSWDICMDYRALSNDKSYIRRIAAGWRRQNRLPEFPGLESDELRRRDQETVAKQIEDSYALISELSGEPIDEIMERRAYTLKRVAAIQRVLMKKKGYFVLPEETRMDHPLARGLDDQSAVKAKMALAEMDWLSVRASTRRVYHNATELGHVMGRLGRVTAEAQRNDPYRGEKLLEYKAWEMLGVAGVERLCEHMLRGQSGKKELDIDGEEIGRVDPVDGPDVRLTIDAELQ
jgi:cell division protein FtsI/penicillin-binding protein 2